MEFEENLYVADNMLMAEYPGLKQVLDMLRTLDEQEQNSLLKKLMAKDPNLVSEIRSELFQSSDFVHIPAQDLVKALNSFERPKLLVALKIASKNVVQHLISGMSARRGQEFLADFKDQGLHPLGEAQAIHREMVMYVKLLVDSGRLSLARR